MQVNRCLKLKDKKQRQIQRLFLLWKKNAGLSSSKTFLGLGLQTAAGVPLQCDEPADFKTFRIGLFGLDKLHNTERSVANLSDALDRILQRDASARAAA